MSHTRSFQPAGAHRLLIFTLVVLLSACGSQSYKSTQVAEANFLDRGITQQVGNITVTAAVPDAAETKALVGLDLYDQGIQPVWLKVENNSPTRARVALWSIDRDYFSPIEVAYMNKRKYSGQGYDDMQRWLYENGLPRFTEPGESTSGLVFTHLRPGTKGFNLSIFANRTAHDFTFFVPLPGFIADFMEVDFANLYDPAEIRDFDRASMLDLLKNELGCCATDASGELDGGPLNAVLIGTGQAVRRAMMRGGWVETSADDQRQERARTQHFMGRSPDAIFTQKREDGNERLQIHLWLAPWRYEGEPVWVATVFYFTEERSILGAFGMNNTTNDSDLLSIFIRESVSADVDSAQRFLLQNLWYNGSLVESGHIAGPGAAPMENPIVGFGGIAYFTDGYRLVVRLSEEHRALDETNFFYQVPYDAAVAEGQ